MSSLAEEYPKEQARVRQILGQYQAIGPEGFFGAAMIEQTLAQADRAATSGYVIDMLKAFEEMKKIKA